MVQVKANERAFLRRQSMMRVLKVINLILNFRLPHFTLNLAITLIGLTRRSTGHDKMSR